MPGLKTLVAAALIATIPVTSALAQAAISEPGAFEAQFPNRDVLNGGALTPAGAGAFTANNPYAAMGSVGPSYRTERSPLQPRNGQLGYSGRHHLSR